jgi:hypothetical protein
MWTRALTVLATLSLLSALPGCIPPLPEDDDTAGDDDTGDDDTGDDDTGDDDTTAPVDADGDGYTEDVDCDDADPTVNPGAWEDCADNTDNDCDGAEDCDDVLCFQEPECWSCAYHDILVIYDIDPTMATAWADFLNLWGHTATITPISDLGQADLWLFELYIIDGDAWIWSFADSQVLLAWGTPILGVGDGIMALDYAGTMLGSAFPVGIVDDDGFTVDDPGHDVYNTPTPMGLAIDTTYPVIPSGELAWALDLSGVSPAQVECLAGAYNYPGYSMVALESDHYAYWGWSAHDPWTWSWEGQFLLTNLIEYLVP